MLDRETEMTASTQAARVLGYGGPETLRLKGRPWPVVGAESALSDSAAAHALSGGGHARGKIILHVGRP
jgi:hypothetical protein